MINDPEIYCLYEKFLESPYTTPEVENIRIQILHNIKHFLEDEDQKMTKLKQAQVTEKTETGTYNIKELNDVAASQGSAVMQKFLKNIEHCLLTGKVNTRKAALDVVYLTTFGGLVHPKNCIPLLMAASADPNPKIRDKADGQLAKNSVNLLQSCAIKGIGFAYELCRNVDPRPDKVVRGYRKTENDFSPLCGYVYFQIRNNKKHRRALLNTYLNAFDNVKSDDLEKLLFIVDTLALLPYGTQDEPLWLLNAIDVFLSVSGSAVLERFRSTCVRKEAKLENKPSDDEGNQEMSVDKTLNDFDEPELGDEQAYKILEEKMSKDGAKLNTFYTKLLACLLLHALKSYLRQAYAVTDKKIQEYIRLSSVSDAALQQIEKQEENDQPEPEMTAEDKKELEKEEKEKAKIKKKQARQKKNEFLKVFERPVNRKIGTDIDEQESVKIVVNFLQSKATENKFTEEKERLELIHHYVMFRQMLEQIDKNEDESGDEKEEKAKIEPVPDEKIISSLKIDKSVKKKVQKMNKKRKRKVSSSDDDPPSEDDLLDYIVDE